jgi:inner membrane protein involved in colicin E2 resistance
MQTTPLVSETAAGAKPARRHAVTFKLLFIAGLILLLQIPLQFVNALRHERSRQRFPDTPAQVDRAEPGANQPKATPPETSRSAVAEGYRMVERSLKYGVLVMALVFAAFFLFEVLSGLRLHAVHYGLVGAALCLFYLALLALGEVWTPGQAYVGAAVASSLLIVAYSVAILRSRLRAIVIAALLAAVHGVLYVVLRMEVYALLAGTAALFVALGGVMYFTRNIDWFAQESGRPAAP